MEMADGSESVVGESRRCEEWFRKAGRVAVARVRVALGSEGTRRDLRVGLEDAAGRRLAPMELTVVDGENGKRLLDGARYGSGEAVMRGLEDGVYELSAESGDEVAVFTLKIGGTGGGEA